MTNQIENIVIVGGGTAGWLAAAYLHRTLNKGGPNCQITLIEASDIDTVGVGEATLPTLRNTLNYLGFAETEWLVQCNATFNMGLKLVNWLTGDDFFWFLVQPDSPAISQLQSTCIAYWLKQKLAGQPVPFSPSVSIAAHLCEAKKAPKGLDQGSYQGLTNYGYHVDAGLLATYLKSKAKSAGVRHIVDKVVDVVLTEQGFIDHLVTKHQGLLSGDLFLDCSGFQGLLINQTLEEPFSSFKETLFCDRAIAINLPTDDAQAGINPHTTATALNTGWVWHTPLYGRSGNGYVYAGDFISTDAAETEFRQHLGVTAAQVEARHLDIRTGHHRRVWVNNCVSLGLAGGFIEPLKSTGIFLIEMGLKHLVQNFPDKQISSSFPDKYNRIMTHYYEELRDFIVLHYYLSQRTDTPFWRAVRHELKLSEPLQTRLERYRTMLPSQEDALEFGLLGHVLPYAYLLLLCGMTYLPDQSAPILHYEDEQAAYRAFATIRTEAEKLMQQLPDHYDYLRQLHLLESLRTVYLQDGGMLLSNLSR